MEENELEDFSEFEKDRDRVFDAGYNRLADTDPELKKDIEEMPLYAEWYEAGVHQREYEEWLQTPDGREYQGLDRGDELGEINKIRERPEDKDLEIEDVDF